MSSYISTNSNAYKTPAGVNLNYTSFGVKKQENSYNTPQITTSNIHSKGRPGGGWGDNEENESDQFVKKQAKGTNMKVPSIKIQCANSTKDSIDSKLASSARSSLSDLDSPKLDILTVDTNFLAQHEYENKVVEDIIVPGGMRWKQPDSTLEKFGFTCENLSVRIIGSLLISKVNQNNNWISKARALYVIEALAKKFVNYLQFFRHNIPTLKNIKFNGDKTNTEQLNKILSTILQELEETNKPSGQSKPIQPNRNLSVSTNSTDNEEASHQVLHTVETTKPTIRQLAQPLPLNTTNIPQKSNSVNTQIATPIKLNETNSASSSNQKNNIPQKSASATPIQAIGKTNVNQNSQPVKIPVHNSLVTSLSDLDFSHEFTPSPYNIYQLYNNNKPASFDSYSPINVQGNNNMGYNQGYYNNNQQNNYPYANSPYNNYSDYNGVNMSQQNAYNNKNFGYNQASQNNSQFTNYNTNNMSNQNQYNNNQTQGKAGKQSLWEDDTVFKQDSGIDYDVEEKKQKAKQAEIENKFNSLSFNF